MVVVIGWIRILLVKPHPSSYYNLYFSVPFSRPPLLVGKKATCLLTTSEFPCLTRFITRIMPTSLFKASTNRADEHKPSVFRITFQRLSKRIYQRDRQHTMPTQVVLTRFDDHIAPNDDTLKNRPSSRHSTTTFTELGSHPHKELLLNQPPCAVPDSSYSQATSASNSESQNAPDSGNLGQHGTEPPHPHPPLALSLSSVPPFTMNHHPSQHSPRAASSSAAVQPSPPAVEHNHLRMQSSTGPISRTTLQRTRTTDMLLSPALTLVRPHSFVIPPLPSINLTLPVRTRN